MSDVPEQWTTTGLPDKRERGGRRSKQSTDAEMILHTTMC